ncbi:MAG: D-glycero-beta-D-manno-heptose 1-phosphate adenylyltransferase [Bacteroidales bacterium]|nr:D-glycero-beta-D-manno-heptose 1-phosphate adenylyltransferase [Bacteroidales bacterium]
MMQTNRLLSLNDIISCLKGKKVVFTNGCFDILHVGHVEYLSKAKTLGEVLVVGLNSDASVKRLKGDDRPINNQNARATVLLALRCVDYVVFFDEDTPQKLIEAINPDVLVKGGDYRREDIVGADFVENNGGKVVIVPLVKGYSTTNIIDSLNTSSNGKR